nr:MAG TPA: hypothetical protein [Caudoviricetes sp.]
MITNKDREAVIDFLITNYSTRYYSYPAEKLIGTKKLNFLSTLKLQLSEYTSKGDSFSISGNYTDRINGMDYSATVAAYKTIFSFDKYNSRLEFLNDVEKVLNTFELSSYEQVNVIKLTIDDVIIEVDLINSTYNVSFIEDRKEPAPVPTGVNIAKMGSAMKDMYKGMTVVKSIRDIMTEE